MPGGRLREQLHKKHGFDSPEQEATLNLFRTHDKLQIRFERLFRAHALTPSQYNILRILRGEGKPMRILDIAERTITEVPGITGLIDRLERAGLVARRRCTEDRRVVFVALTAPAAELLARLDRPVAELHEQLLGHLTRAEQRELTRLLEKVRAPLE